MPFTLHAALECRKNRVLKQGTNFDPAFLQKVRQISSFGVSAAFVLLLIIARAKASFSAVRRTGFGAKPGDFKGRRRL
jgi:hypothetical protein